MTKGNMQEQKAITGGEVIEQWITTKDGVPMYTKTWKAISSRPIATVVFIHGISEHVNRYDYVFSKFSNKNIEVFAHDQRGFGQTAVRNNNPGEPGSWDVALNDINDVIIAQRKPGIPQFLMGHSMGGSLGLHYASYGPEKDNLAGFVISVPSVTLISALAKVANFLNMIIPNYHISLPLHPKYMTHDPEMQKQLREDPLIFKTVSINTIATVILEGKALLESKYVSITSPIYICHGSDDPVIFQESSKELYEKIPSQDKTYRLWPGLYHEPHNEFEKDQVIDDYLQWILARVKE
ncbi:4809_t:CDS:2 [Diversispora eburnea]|uniref:4809_t:CDS:1 n=1 Tax=Diversispora eburnea TaxID=1213867 RepID=A0A9N9GKX7_9GLOM|nr:4809_t:CDS:2 [Diversispora eburnea]